MWSNMLWHVKIYPKLQEVQIFDKFPHMSTIYTWKQTNKQKSTFIIKNQEKSNKRY